MRTNAWVWILAGVMVMAAAPGWAQRGDARADRGSRGRSSGSGGTTNFNYNDISRRDTRNTEREERKKKDAEEAKKKADEEKRQKERRERYEKYQNDKKEREENGKKDDKSKAGASAKPANQAAVNAKGFAALKQQVKAGNAAHAAAAGNAAASVDPTSRPVTEVMLDAVKTKSVHFNPEEAKKNPNLILLNPPKYDPTQRVRAGDYGIGQAL